MRENFCEKMQCWDRRQNLEREINSRIFHGFLSAALFGGGEVWGLTGLISAALSAQMQACVSAPRLPADFPDEAHLHTQVLGYPWQVLLLLVLALY